MADRSSDTSIGEVTATYIARTPPADTATVVPDPPVDRRVTEVVRGDGSRFRVLRPHAKGGLGAVSVARDQELGRDVALKEIQPRFAHDTGSRGRFVLEAEVTGALGHPGVVPVYGLGQYEDGRPYYAMRFVRGDSLKEAADRFHAAGGNAADGRTFRSLLGRLVDVCNAIAYAHDRGVVHRDLKPGNVMLGKYGETLVVHWGLAKVLGRDDLDIDNDESPVAVSSGDSCATVAGSAIGTPASMPPEQAEGDVANLGPAADVYSLGATLFYILTGRPPISGGSLADVLAAVKAGDVPSARSVNAECPASLSAVAAKAMSRNPGDRYAAPAELAEELERWLADEPVAAAAEPLSVRAEAVGSQAPGNGRGGGGRGAGGVGQPRRVLDGRGRQERGPVEGQRGIDRVERRGTGGA